MAVEEVLRVLTLPLLLGATLTSLMHVVRQTKEGKRVINDFTTLISVFIMAWLSMEMLAMLGRGLAEQVVDFVHFLVVVTFAIMLTLRWRWAIREVTKPLEKKT